MCETSSNEVCLRVFNVDTFCQIREMWVLIEDQKDFAFQDYIRWQVYKVSILSYPRHTRHNTQFPVFEIHRSAAGIFQLDPIDVGA